MVQLIYGRNGSGKTDRIFSEMAASAAKRRVFLLVPDREAVAAESRAAELHHAENIDVVTFNRLCNYIFRRYGGLCADYIGKGAKKLIMRNVVKKMAPALKEYGETNGFGMFEKLVEFRTACYHDGIAPSDLEEACRLIENEQTLLSKASDLALIFSAFDLEVASRFEDPDGMLSCAESFLHKNDFFGGCDVFIDSFSSFSVQQYGILSHIMKCAENTYITLPFLPEERREASVRCLADTERRLFRTASKVGIEKMETVILQEAHRYQNEELAFLSQNIAKSTPCAKKKGKPQNIRIVRAVNAFAEAEAVAIDICRSVREEGMRYRDMAVIARDPSIYEGVLDAVFRKYEIPFFFSSRKEISEKPLVKLIFSAFSIAERGFRGADVISYIKTGYAGISAEEISLFENYIIKWNLRGKLFTGEDAWNMHPRGYGMTFSEEDMETLRHLAEIRARVIAPLKNFSSAGKTVSSVRDRATLLFDFLSLLHVPETLSQKAAQAKERGESALAMETVQLWNVFCGALDQLVLSCGETEASVSEFSQMLSMVLLETDIGKIPTSIDEVSVSSAAQTLPGGHRKIYLFGAQEGAFPQRITENGLFSEHEKSLLRENGVELTDRLEKRASEELYYFYRAAVLPSESLFISFSHYSLSGTEQKESVGVKRILSLFEDLKTEDFERFSVEARLEGKKASFEKAMSEKGNLGRALREYYETDEEYAEKIKYIHMPLGAEQTVLSAENAALLFPGKLSTSYSRLEKFIKCRFAYFCEYELKLRDDSPASFGALDVGSFMHGILEKTVQWIASGAKGDLSENIRLIAKGYIAQVFHMSPEAVPKRLSHLFRYLCNSAALFAEKIKEEMAQSDFKVRDFELTIGKEGNAVAPLRLSGDGISVELRGKIDRVDTYENGEGNLFIRVIDYKTGNKTFKLDNVRLGLDMQMLLYLFSIWENGEKRYGKEPNPAGVLYSGIKPPQADMRIGDDPALLDVSVGASGLFLKDENVLRAMEPLLEGKYIPVKESDLAKEKPILLGKEAFIQLKEDVTQTVLQYASELKKGVAHAKPLKAGGTSPCEYCKMKAVCRVAK